MNHRNLYFHRIDTKENPICKKKFSITKAFMGNSNHQKNQESVTVCTNIFISQLEY